ncbi:hypothetical protein IMZ48_17485 [Candidatus Bathyarchaeota archaeon]|nr:hypothetical protein [Candidatus Bathyarchaeota archaeon]
MTLTERAAASEPLNATVVVLDTLRKEVQKSDPYLEIVYEKRGMTRPKEIITNEEWYIRLGYSPIPGPEYFTWVNPKTGEKEEVPIIFLRKWLA